MRSPVFLFSGFVSSSSLLYFIFPFRRFGFASLDPKCRRDFVYEFHQKRIEIHVNSADNIFRVDFLQFDRFFFFFGCLSHDQMINDRLECVVSGRCIRFPFNPSREKKPQFTSHLGGVFLFFWFRRQIYSGDQLSSIIISVFGVLVRQPECKRMRTPFVLCLLFKCMPFCVCVHY